MTTQLPPLSTDIALPIASDLSFILFVKIWVPESFVPEFWTHFKPAYDAVINEPECRFFLVCPNPQEPGCLSWIEGWSKDVDWFMGVQAQKDYYKPYLEATEKVFTKPRQFEILRPVKDVGAQGLCHFKLPINNPSKWW